MMEDKQREWDGEGLPPVGTVCEARMSFDGWVKVHVLHHHHLGNEAVVVVEGDGQAEWADEFRPISTPSQRAEDEANYELAAVIFNSHPSHSAASSRDGAHAIYTAIREGRIPGVKLDQ